MTIDWVALHEAAIGVSQRAYAPYSRFRVGAAGLTDRGRIVVGCNVENASYGLTVCAEVTMVGMLHVIGDDGERLVAVATVTADGAPATPCGRCRQVLAEHGDRTLLVNGDGPSHTIEALLPGMFTVDDLHEHREL